MLNFSHNKQKRLLLFSAIGFVVIILLIRIIFSFSKPNYILGNIFFGDIQRLYNVHLAEYFFTRAINPTYGTTTTGSHYQLARVYFVTGQLTKAQEEVEKELALSPENIKSYYLLGLIYGYLGFEQKGIAMFDKFLEKKPESWAARNDKAWLQFRVGDIDGALATIEPVVEVAQYTVWIQNTYCALLINKKRYVEAKEICEQAQWLAENMTEKNWGRAYPGNDPRIYSTGISSMQSSVYQNIQLLNSYLQGN